MNSIVVNIGKKFHLPKFKPYQVTAQFIREYGKDYYVLGVKIKEPQRYFGNQSEFTDIFFAVSENNFYLFKHFVPDKLYVIRTPRKFVDENGMVKLPELHELYKIYRLAEMPYLGGVNFVYIVNGKHSKSVLDKFWHDGYAEIDFFDDEISANIGEIVVPDDIINVNWKTATFCQERFEDNEYTMFRTDKGYVKVEEIEEGFKITKLFER